MMTPTQGTAIVDLDKYINLLQNYKTAKELCKKSHEAIELLLNQGNFNIVSALNPLSPTILDRETHNKIKQLLQDLKSI